MADKTINQLTQATGLTDSSLFVIEQNSTAKQANWGMMKNYISPGVAAQYSTSATYNVGDYVIYNDSLYRCNTAITTGEAWTAAHWTAAVLGDDVGELKSALKDVISHNSADLIPLFATYNNRTVFDITFTFSADKKSCIADGTATGPARTYLFNDLHAVPDEIKPGETYHVKVTSTSQYLYLYFIFYDANETIILTRSIGSDKDLTIPEETIGIVISVAVSNGQTVNNAQITFEILNAKSNKTLETDIDAIAENVRTGALTIAQGDIISGTYNSTGGVVANSARIRTNDFIKTYEGEELIFNPGTKAREMLIGYFDTEKRFIKDGTWVSSADPITMTNGYILLAYRTSSGNEAIAPSDYDADTYIIADWRADIDVLMNGTVENIPLYYFDNDYLPGKANEVNQIGLGLSRKSGRWVFITDYHSAANAGHSPSLIHYLLRKCGIKNTVFNGDAITRYDSKIMAYNELCNFVDSFNRVSEISSMYYVTGNHEYNNSDLQHSEYELSKSALFMLFNDPLKDAVCLANTNSFYVDDNNAKIRYYFIDCERGALIAVATIRSVLKSLENTPNDYGVVIFSHTGLTTDNSAIIERFEYILAGFKAWNDGVNYMYEGVTYNYEGTATEREFVGAITGHTHLEGYIIYDGRFPVIAVPCDCYKAPQQVSHPERVAGTIFEQAFEVLQIDIDAKRIYLTRIGWGNNRTFSFGSGAGLIT